jgi:hypothetical protein
MKGVSVPEWLLEDTLNIAGVLAGAAAIYVIVLALLGKLTGNGLRGSFGRVIFRTLAIGLILAVIAITSYEIVAFYFRHDPPGFASFERQGNEHVSFVYWAQVAFFALYGIIPLITVAVARFVRQSRPGHAVLAGLLAGLGVFAYLVITFPFVEFLNACMVGRSFLLPSGC